MKKITSNVCLNVERLASLLDTQPSEVEEAFQFLLATAMHEAGKFELLSVADVDGRWHYTFSGAGEVLSVVCPEMSKEMERKVREEVRACPAGKDYYQTLGQCQVK